MFSWMAWTLPVAVFFSCIVLMLVGMTLWELRSPTVMRKGWLPMATTRGDRLFIGLLLARTLTSVNAKPIVATMTRTVSASGMDWATLAAAGVLTIVPGAIVIWFVRHYIAKGFAMGRV